MASVIELRNVDAVGSDTCPCFACGAEPLNRERHSNAAPHHDAGVFEAQTDNDASTVRRMFEEAGAHRPSVRQAGQTLNDINSRGIGITVCEADKERLRALREAVRSNAMYITLDIIKNVLR